MQTQTVYRPLRRQASVNNASAHTASTNQNRQTLDTDSRVRPHTKVDYPRKTTDIFNVTPSRDQQRQVRDTSTQMATILSHVRQENRPEVSPNRTAHRRPDHSREYILHCAPTDQPVSQTPAVPFVPKYREESLQQRRQRDFINVEGVSAPPQWIPPRPPSAEPVLDRLMKPRKSDMMSNIFAIPEKDSQNIINLMKDDQTSTLQATYGKSVTHPWLQHQDIGPALVNEFANVTPNYAHTKKQQELLTSGHHRPQLQQQKDPETPLYNKFGRSKSYARTKSDLISSNQPWNQFDSTLHGKELQNQLRSEHPLPTTGVKRAIQPEQKEVEESRLPLGTLHNKMYNIRTPSKQANDVNVIELELKGETDERQLRSVCRESGWHLVKYEGLHDCISNTPKPEAKAVVRTSATPTKSASLAKLQSELETHGVKAKEAEQQNGHKAMHSEAWVQQEQQRKELEELERYYHEQAVNFIKSKPTSKKSKYSHVY